MGDQPGKNGGERPPIEVRFEATLAPVGILATARIEQRLRDRLKATLRRFPIFLDWADDIADSSPMKEALAAVLALVFFAAYIPFSQHSWLWELEWFGILMTIAILALDWRSKYLVTVGRRRQATYWWFVTCAVFVAFCFGFWALIRGDHALAVSEQGATSSALPAPKATPDFDGGIGMAADMVRPGIFPDHRVVFMTAWIENHGKLAKITKWSVSGDDYDSGELLHAYFLSPARTVKFSTTIGGMAAVVKYGPKEYLVPKGAQPLRRYDGALMVMFQREVDTTTLKIHFWDEYGNPHTIGEESPEMMPKK